MEHLSGSQWQGKLSAAAAVAAAAAEHISTHTWHCVASFLLVRPISIQHVKARFQCLHASFCLLQELGIGIHPLKPPFLLQQSYHAQHVHTPLIVECVNLT